MNRLWNVEGRFGLFAIAFLMLSACDAKEAELEAASKKPWMPVDVIDVEPVEELCPVLEESELFEDFSGGVGSVANPWQIERPAQLNKVRQNLAAAYVLISDVDLNCFPFKPIAGDMDPAGPGFNGEEWSGSFDGAGHTISNLQMVTPEEDYVALFGSSLGGTLKNLRLVNFVISGRSSVATLIGRSHSTIDNVHVFNPAVTATSWTSGGLVASNMRSLSNSSARNVYIQGDHVVGGLAGDNVWHLHTGHLFSTGTVRGRGWTGGLIGQTWRDVRYSFSTASVFSDGSMVGGFTGISANGNLLNVFSTGDATGPGELGGLAGTFFVSNSTLRTVTASYSTGDVTHFTATEFGFSLRLGPFVGHITAPSFPNHASLFVNAFRNSESTVTVIDPAVPSTWGTPLSPAQMELQQSWTGFSFGSSPNQWTMPAVDYHLPDAVEGYRYPIMNWMVGIE